MPKLACHHRLRAVRRQRGVSLFIALIVLVAMALGGLMLLRSVDTTTLITGNLAFQQAATASAETGLNRAIEELIDMQATDGLDDNDPTRGYFATMSATQNPAANQSWEDYWNEFLAASAYTLPADATGNTVSYVIHRQCANTSSPSAGGQCVASTFLLRRDAEVGCAFGCDFEFRRHHFRITVRVAGPRNTVSMIQSFVTIDEQG